MRRDRGHLKSIGYTGGLNLSLTNGGTSYRNARPKSAIQLAELDGRPGGCVTHQDMNPGVAAIERQFVDPAGAATA